jgi:hypothetical protein
MVAEYRAVMARPRFRLSVAQLALWNRLIGNLARIVVDPAIYAAPQYAQIFTTRACDPPCIFVIWPKYLILGLTVSFGRTCALGA